MIRMSDSYRFDLDRLSNRGARRSVAQIGQF